MQNAFPDLTRNEKEYWIERISSFTDYENRRLDVEYWTNVVQKRLYGYLDKHPEVLKHYFFIDRKAKAELIEMVDTYSVSEKLVRYVDYETFAEANFGFDIHEEGQDFDYTGYNDEGCHPKWSLTWVDEDSERHQILSVDDSSEEVNVKVIYEAFKLKCPIKIFTKFLHLMLPFHLNVDLVHMRCLE